MSQNRKNNKAPDSTTCQIKLKPGPVNRMDPVAAQRITKARINRVRCFKTGFVFISQMLDDVRERLVLVSFIRRIVFSLNPQEKYLPPPQEDSPLKIPDFLPAPLHH